MLSGLMNLPSAGSCVAGVVEVETGAGVSYLACETSFSIEHATCGSHLSKQVKTLRVDYVR